MEVSLLFIKTKYRLEVMFKPPELYLFVIQSLCSVTLWDFIAFWQIFFMIPGPQPWLWVQSVSAFSPCYQARPRRFQSDASFLTSIIKLLIYKRVNTIVGLGMAIFTWPHIWMWHLLVCYIIIHAVWPI